MINLVKGSSLIKFDQQLPFYNWLYPMKGQELEGKSYAEYLPHANEVETRSRALYFHIPFCDTICTFCTLSRGIGHEGEEQVERYVQALLKEIQLKARFDNVVRHPIRAIFFGGGTPSILSADQIARIGAAIHEHFDMSEIEEFCFETEVKSVTEEKSDAMRSIGVNKVRFGGQTFSPKYRKLFNLTATDEQIVDAVAIFRKYFDYTSIDMIYGMHGQTIEEFTDDLHAVTSLGTETLELYPITNVVTQAPLHHGYKAQALAPLSFMQKMSMTIYLNQFMRSAGYQLHNGHGFVKLNEKHPGTPGMINSTYQNIYNEHTWAHHDYDLIGFGSSAISQVGRYTVMNDENRARYVEGLLGDVDLKTSVSIADHIPYERGLIFRLPYFGSIEHSEVRWDLIGDEYRIKIDELVGEGLLADNGSRLEVTELGWIWYVNMMYYLSPASDQRVLDDFVKLKDKTRGLTDGERKMMSLPIGRRV